MPDPNRRAFLLDALVKGLCATAVLSPGRSQRPGPQDPVAAPPRPRARADAVIQVHLGGGLSHLDSFDPKPDAPIEVRGPFEAIDTAVDGIRLSATLPAIAKVVDRLTLLRACTHTEADHDRGTHSVLTGYQPNPALVHPSLGAVVAHTLGMQNQLPPYICVPTPADRFAGPGFLGAAFAPFAVGGNPAAERFAVRDLLPPPEVDADRRRRREALLQTLDAGFAVLGTGDVVAASAAFRRQANALVESPTARAAFDLTAEPAPRRARFGKHALGQGCLLALRLATAGARYVAVNAGGFDHHEQLQAGLSARLLEVDQAFAALIEELDAQGSLDRTLVLLTTEFGRTPKLNATAGRDHWPRVFSMVAAGGGVRRGHLYGSSTANGGEPDRDAVTPADLAATVYHLLGLDPEQRLMAAGNRPVALVKDGRVLTEILA